MDISKLSTPGISDLKKHFSVTVVSWHMYIYETHTHSNLSYLWTVKLLYELGARYSSYFHYLSQLVHVWQ